jgi:hypothetical protein
MMAPKKAKSKQPSQSQKSKLNNSAVNMKCIICDEVFDDDASLNCDRCGQHIHCSCWDADMPPEFCEYIRASRHTNATGLRVYCTTCLLNIDQLNNFDARIRSIEDMITKMLPVIPAVQITSKSYAQALSNPTTSNFQTASATTANQVATNEHSVHDEIKEALDKERRKNNVVIFNISENESTADSEHVKPLFQDLLGRTTSLYTCSRLGKITNKPRPLLVKFTDECDKIAVIKSAPKLKLLTNTWPRISIAPDRTKREQISHKALLQDCKARQARGEQVIVVGNSIVPDKRRRLPSTDASRPSTQLPSPPVHPSWSTSDDPLTVNLPPLEEPSSSLNH